MNPNPFADQAARIAESAADLANQLAAYGTNVIAVVEPTATAVEPFMFLLAIFLMACFVGYYVVWNVTPALHSPLMGVTNAISSVIVVGAMLAVGLSDSLAARFFGFLAVMLASVNIFGGFTVTQRMLAMFQGKKPLIVTGTGKPGLTQRMQAMFQGKKPLVVKGAGKSA